MVGTMTAARRLVLDLAQREEAYLARKRAKREAQALKAVCGSLIAERFHGRVSHERSTEIPEFHQSKASPSQIIVRTMVERRMTTRELADCMEGDPLRNLTLLRLLFDGGGTMGTAIEERIAAGLARGTA